MNFGPFPASFCLFSSFQTHITILTANKCEKYPSSIRCWDSNPWPLEHESPPITTRPGHPPKPLFSLHPCLVAQNDLFYRAEKNFVKVVKMFLNLIRPEFRIPSSQWQKIEAFSILKIYSQPLKEWEWRLGSVWQVNVYKVAQKWFH